jgi:hypothetical protein
LQDVLLRQGMGVMVGLGVAVAVGLGVAVAAGPIEVLMPPQLPLGLAKVELQPVGQPQFDVAVQVAEQSETACLAKPSVAFRHLAGPFHGSVQPKAHG